MRLPEGASGLILGGVHVRELPAVRRIPAVPYVAVGLTRMDEFDSAAFRAAVQDIAPSQGLLRDTKYIAQAVPVENAGDVLYVFPEQVRHVGFYWGLEKENGMFGTLRSAGFLWIRTRRNDLNFDGKSSSLENRLPYEASNSYRDNVLAAKLGHDGFSYGS